MRVSVLFTSVMALAIAASSASAMDADQILERLRAQADATKTIHGGGATRGLSVSYGDDELTAAPQGSSVVSVPSAPTAQPLIQSEPATQAQIQPASVGTGGSVSAVPVYTTREQATTTAVRIESLPVSTIVAPTSTAATIDTVTLPVDSPTYISASPTFTAEQAPVVQQVAARPNADTYTSVDSSQRVDLRIFFEWNSASLKAEAIGQLAELCTAIRLVGASPENRFKIIGHTDKSGSDEYNLYLSNARAREVKRHLVEECALPPASLIAVGEGERQSRPEAPSNAPEERRVEIQFVS